MNKEEINKRKGCPGPNVVLRANEAALKTMKTWTKGKWFNILLRQIKSTLNSGNEKISDFDTKKDLQITKFELLNTAKQGFGDKLKGKKAGDIKVSFLSGVSDDDERMELSLDKAIKFFSGQGAVGGFTTTYDPEIIINEGTKLNWRDVNFVDNLPKCWVPGGGTAQYSTWKPGSGVDDKSSTDTDGEDQEPSEKKVELGDLSSAINNFHKEYLKSFKTSEVNIPCTLDPRKEQSAYLKAGAFLDAMGGALLGSSALSLTGKFAGRGAARDAMIKQRAVLSGFDKWLKDLQVSLAKSGGKVSGKMKALSGAAAILAGYTAPIAFGDEEIAFERIKEGSSVGAGLAAGAAGALMLPGGYKLITAAFIALGAILSPKITPEENWACKFDRALLGAALMFGPGAIYAGTSFARYKISFHKKFMARMRQRRSYTATSVSDAKFMEILDSKAAFESFEESFEEGFDSIFKTKILQGAEDDEKLARQTYEAFISLVNYAKTRLPIASASEEFVGSSPAELFSITKELRKQWIEKYGEQQAKNIEDILIKNNVITDLQKQYNKWFEKVVRLVTKEADSLLNQAREAMDAQLDLLKKGGLKKITDRIRSAETDKEMLKAQEELFQLLKNAFRQATEADYRAVIASAGEHNRLATEMHELGREALRRMGIVDDELMGSYASEVYQKVGEYLTKLVDDSSNFLKPGDVFENPGKAQELLEQNPIPSAVEMFEDIFKIVEDTVGETIKMIDSPGGATRASRRFQRAPGSLRLGKRYPGDEMARLFAAEPKETAKIVLDPENWPKAKGKIIEDLADALYKKLNETIQSAADFRAHLWRYQQKKAALVKTLEDQKGGLFAVLNLKGPAGTAGIPRRVIRNIETAVAEMHLALDAPGVISPNIGLIATAKGAAQRMANSTIRTIIKSTTLGKQTATQVAIAGALFYGVKDRVGFNWNRFENEKVVQFWKDDSQSTGNPKEAKIEMASLYFNMLIDNMIKNPPELRTKDLRKDAVKFTDFFDIEKSKVKPADFSNKWMNIIYTAPVSTVGGGLSLDPGEKKRNLSPEEEEYFADMPDFSKTPRSRIKTSAGIPISIRNSTQEEVVSYLHKMAKQILNSDEAFKNTKKLLPAWMKTVAKRTAKETELFNLREKVAGEIKKDLRLARGFERKKLSRIIDDSIDKYQPDQAIKEETEPKPRPVTRMQTGSLASTGYYATRPPEIPVSYSSFTPSSVPGRVSGILDDMTLLGQELITVDTENLQGVMKHNKPIIKRYVSQMSQENFAGLPGFLNSKGKEYLVALIQAESMYDPLAVSAAGAEGLGQFLPGTAKDRGIDPYNAEQAIKAIPQHLKYVHGQLNDLKGGPGQVYRKMTENQKATAILYAYQRGEQGGFAIPVSIIIDPKKAPRDKKNKDGTVRKSTAFVMTKESGFWDKFAGALDPTLGRFPRGEAKISIEDVVIPAYFQEREYFYKNGFKRPHAPYATKIKNIANKIKFDKSKPRPTKPIAIQTKPKTAGDIPEMKKIDLEKLVKQMLTENSGQGYAPYPYGSSVREEEQPEDDYREEWKSFCADVIKDMETRIKVAKALVKDEELFEDILDAAGQNQSIGQELLKKINEMS